MFHGDQTQKVMPGNLYWLLSSFIQTIQVSSTIPHVGLDALMCPWLALTVAMEKTYAEIETGLLSAGEEATGGHN